MNTKQKEKENAKVVVEYVQSKAFVEKVFLVNVGGEGYIKLRCLFFFQGPSWKNLLIKVTGEQDNQNNWLQTVVLLKITKSSMMTLSLY